MKNIVMYWSVVLPIILTMVGMTFGVIPCVLLAVLIAVVAAIAWRRRRLSEKKCQRLHPKDYTYYLYLRSKHSSAKPMHELILREFPQMNGAEAEAWIKEFEKLESYKNRIAAAGGSWTLGKEKVRELLVKKFPFLAMLGLRSAISQAAYFACRGGYHKYPKLKAEEI